MLFNSAIFIFVFLPSILTIWWLLQLSTRVKLIALVLASYVFYGWWDYRFCALLLVSTLVDYHAGRSMYHAASARRRIGWLLASLVTNLGFLGFFKYAGFGAQALNAFMRIAHEGDLLAVPHIILPVGISFYTFQTMSYSIDIFRGHAKPTEGFWHFAAYVSMFPQLIAGPIVRYSAMEAQLRSIPVRFCWDTCARGAFFFIMGMSQKILLADAIATRINPMFDDYAALQFAGSWYAMLGYSCQLYFDFSGYSNMAVGLGYLLGFEFPQNFNSPYKAVNISDFWRRWHMTLSGWLRDYLFIPLGGSQYGRLLTLRNLVIVMFLGGLWHGAGWTFVVWGLYHGALLAICHLLRNRVTLAIPHTLCVACTFVCIVVGWTIFRATDMQMALHLLGSMAGNHGFEIDPFSALGGSKALALLAGLLTIVFASPNIYEMKLRPNMWLGVAMGLALAVSVLRFGQESPFLYFQF